jgi:hypothetical protein
MPPIHAVMRSMTGLLPDSRRDALHDGLVARHCDTDEIDVPNARLWTVFDGRHEDPL